jgi:hypothetical protein
VVLDILRRLDTIGGLVPDKPLIQFNQQNVMAGGVTFADLLREATNGVSRTVEGERGATDPDDALALEPPEGESPAPA